MNISRLPKPDLKIITAAAVFLCCLGSGWLLYNHLYKETPEYAFSQLVEAVSEGNLSQIDANMLAGQVFDGLNKYNYPKDRHLLQHLMQFSQKDEFVSAVSALLTQTDRDKSAAAARTIEQLSSQAGVPIPAEGWHYQSSSWSRRTADGYAELTSFIYNDALNASIPWTVQLERTAPHQWRIISFSHLNETFQALKDACQRNRKDRIAAVQKQLEKFVTVKNLSAEIVTDTSLNQTFLRLRYILDVTEKGKSEIRNISGFYELRRRSDNALLYAAPIQLSPSGSSSRVSQFPLNLHSNDVSSDTGIKTLDDTQSRLYITAVTKTDGTALTLPNDPVDYAQLSP